MRRLENWKYEDLGNQDYTYSLETNQGVASEISPELSDERLELVPIRLLEFQKEQICLTDLFYLVPNILKLCSPVLDFRKPLGLAFCVSGES